MNAELIFLSDALSSARPRYAKFTYIAQRLRGEEEDDLRRGE